MALETRSPRLGGRVQIVGARVGAQQGEPLGDSFSSPTSIKLASILRHRCLSRRTRDCSTASESIAAAHQPNLTPFRRSKGLRLREPSEQFGRAQSSRAALNASKCDWGQHSAPHIAVRESLVITIDAKIFVACQLTSITFAAATANINHWLVVVHIL